MLSITTQKQEQFNMSHQRLIEREKKTATADNEILTKDDSIKY